MKLKVLTAAAFLLATTSFVQAAGIDDVLGALESQGFTITEVKTIDGLIYVEAIFENVQRELIYDAATGDLLKDEVGGEILAGTDEYPDLNDAVSEDGLDDESVDGESDGENDSNDDDGSDDNNDSNDVSNDDSNDVSNDSNDDNDNNDDSDESDNEDC